MDVSPQAEVPPLGLRNVTKFYGDFKAVDDVRFTLGKARLPGSEKVRQWVFTAFGRG